MTRNRCPEPAPERRRSRKPDTVGHDPRPQWRRVVGSGAVSREAWSARFAMSELTDFAAHRPGRRGRVRRWRSSSTQLGDRLRSRRRRSSWSPPRWRPTSGRAARCRSVRTVERIAVVALIVDPAQRRHGYRLAALPRGRRADLSIGVRARSSPPGCSPSPRTGCWASTGSSPASSARRWRRPTLPSCSRCSAGARSAGARARRWRARRASTTRPASR